ncbi:hypothetical protein MAPG_08765 [Magnaporthiopsis poae ATCC 64411]|uniref:Uncharacterized protein n=1 Tax=Magnaporthiopsis poae (strain ATCC 64411 / 73-15) TaxID=644358 RepID=A0A0C4E873_MAGP6|nr:hypothetical protein MAPG_08765 [Magnaporthiopsis poae ATCC 64411]
MRLRERTPTAPAAPTNHPWDRHLQRPRGIAIMIGQITTSVGFRDMKRPSPVAIFLLHPRLRPDAGSFIPTPSAGDARPKQHRPGSVAAATPASAARLPSTWRNSDLVQGRPSQNGAPTERNPGLPRSPEEAKSAIGERASIVDRDEAAYDPARLFTRQTR